MSIDKEAIRSRALDLIAANGHQVGSRLATEFGISRQVANGYLKALEREGAVEGQGSTRARAYRLKILAEVERSYPREGLDEDVVWRELLAPPLADLPQNVRGIWHHALTEMINNAIDHSGSEQVRTGLRRNALFSEAWVADEGEGIFVKIQRALGLYDPREAILELAKGKLTTSPQNHSGEGIFFTSRMVDGFEIRSGTLHFSHAERSADALTDRDAELRGTVVVMRLANASTRTARSVFDEFSDSEEYTFDRTVVPVRLAQHEGEQLVSRSQAKRVALRFERFKHVVLDFAGVEEIGQAFADELFRVFAAAHPEVRLTPTNTSAGVASMVRRALSAGGAR